MGRRGGSVSGQGGRFASALRRLVEYAEIDQATWAAFFTRLWTLAAGPVTMAVVAAYFSFEVQGYYFTFYSILGLYTFLELGLGAVIVQFASHEWAGLGLDPAGRIRGEADALSRLASLARFAFRWYAGVGLTSMAGLAAAGWAFFSRAPAGREPVAWGGPWTVLCVVCGLNIVLMPVLSLLEGCNQVGEVYRFRLWQNVATNAVMWTAAALGANLWTVSIFYVVSAGMSLYAAGVRYRAFFGTLWRVPRDGARVRWRRELLPLQWRIAVSYMCAYLAFQLFVPVVFRYRGPGRAGQMGLTWHLIGAVGAMTWALMSPKMPRFGVLIASRRFEDMDRLFFRLYRITAALLVAGSLALWGGVCVLEWVPSRFMRHFAGRLLPPLPTALFIAGYVVLSLTTGVLGTYLTVHKKQPQVPINIAAALLTAASTWWLGSRYGATGVGAGFLAVNVLLAPAMVALWRRCRREWHGNGAPANG